MPNYLDCPGCACLVAAHDPTCPFCGAEAREGGAPGWLLGVVLGLGVALAGCNEKEGGESQSTQDSTPDGVTYAGPDESWTVTDSVATDDGATISASEVEPDGTTYAGPDETSSTTPQDTSSSTGESSSGGESSSESSSESGSESSSGEGGSSESG